MLGAILAFGWLSSPCLQRPADVAAAEKTAFFKMFEELPSKGEFYTEESVEKAATHTRVFLSLTEADVDNYAKSIGLETYTLYPFFALSYGLVERKDQREFGVKHFAAIAHPSIKLCWGVLLFDKKAASPEIIAFLRKAVEMKEQSKIISNILGPRYDDFKEQLKNAK